MVAKIQGTDMSNLQTIIDDFEYLDDWEDRYRYLIEIGKALPQMPDSEQIDENKVDCHA